jgi:hypothetical protein
MDGYGRLFFTTVAVLLSGIVMILLIGQHWTDLKLYTVLLCWTLVCGVPYFIFLRKSRTM